MRGWRAGCVVRGVGSGAVPVLLLVAAVLLTGCATGTPVGLRIAAGDIRHRRMVPADSPVPKPRAEAPAPRASVATSGGSGPAALVARMALGAAVQEDALEALLARAGLDDSREQLPGGVDVTPEDAAALYDALLARPVTLAGFGPRRVAFHLLGEIMEGEDEVPRAALVQRLERYRFLAVLRPDGYLAWAVSGRTQQRVAPVQWREGAFRAGPFEVGPFYSGERFVFRPVDEGLRSIGASPPLAEVYDDADVINRALDGAAEAYLELALASGHLLWLPIDSLRSLGGLPEGLAALIASSPGYFERFRLMTRGEQVQALSKLTTTLLSTHGAAAGTTRTLASAGRALESASVSALVLSADGALAVARVSVPVGRMATALRGGPGAALILHRANQAGQGSGPAPAKGPGQWGPSHESMSRRAARYQQQISGRPVDEAYWVGGVGRKSGGLKFDGFQDGVLLEAKGPGYANKFLDNLAPQPWFTPSGARQLITQARQQFNAAKGVPIRWHVAEEKAAHAIRKLLKDAKVLGVEVVHTPALP
jgi:predicted small secreted protein